MNNGERAREAVTEALGRFRELRAKRVADGDSQSTALRTRAEPALEGLLRSYRELAAVAARLEKTLGADDPMRAEVHAALTQARTAWAGMLIGEDPDPSGAANSGPDPAFSVSKSAPTVEEGRDTKSSQASGPHPKEDVAAADTVDPGTISGKSVELVPAPTSQAVVKATRRLPDEAALVRYLRRRRERRRLPDESVIGRRRRERRERGPCYPDEAAIARYLRRRRERR